MSTLVFEQLLQEVGDSGRHQQLLFLLFVVPINFLIPWVALTQIFMTSVPTHWCHVPDRPQEVTSDQWRAFTIPKEIQDGVAEYSQCQQFNVTWDALKELDLSTDIQSLASTLNASFGIIKCRSRWEYSREVYESTLSMDHDWVCERDYLGANWQSVSLAGNVVGTLIFNSLSDLVGRRPVFVVASMTYAVFGVIRLYMMNFSYEWLMITTFLAAMSFPAILELPLIIVMEQVSSTWRARITSTSFILWTFGMCVLPLISWLTRDWVLLGLITTIPFFPCILAWWFLPESPRWLLSRNRLEETASLLKSIAHRNGRSVPDKLEQRIQTIAEVHNTEKNYGVFQLFKYSRIRVRMILLTACYACNNLFYYGLVYNTTNISGNEFLNFFLLSITELPSNLLAWWASEYIGRRWTEAGSSMLAAIFALIAAFIIANGDSRIVITILILSKMFITMSFMVIYIQCAEIYPTTHRAAGTGLSSLISSCFGTASPYIAYVSAYGNWVPYVILFGIGMFGFICGSLLPETLDVDLPQSLLDASNFLPSETYLSYKGKTPCSKAAVDVRLPNTEQRGHVNRAVSESNVDDVHNTSC